VGNFRHRRGRILFEVFAAFIIGSGSAAGWLAFHFAYFAVTAVGVSLYGCWRALTLFLLRDPAISFDHKVLRVGRFFNVSTFKWNEVREIRVGRWRMDAALARRLPSWIPLEREYLELMVPARGLDVGWIKLRTDLIELPPGGAEELVELIRAVQVQVIGGRGAAMARLGMSADEQAAPSRQLTGIQAERLRRLGLDAETEALDDGVPADEPVAAPQPFMPPRPVFGRKVS
jgi:hypothetical protein